MFVRALAADSGNLDGFSRPVESIMRCEDFKSNFARRLSTRYTSKSPVGSQPDNALKLPPTVDHPLEPKLQVQAEAGSMKVAQSSIRETVVEVPKTLDQTTRSAVASEMRSTEVTALTMEVDTLRWQLAQTEANRQMHLALLKQIVSFLNRVKEHMVCQKQDEASRREPSSIRMSPRHHASDLPRSRSVLHVSRNEYCVAPVKKLATRKISKSISNVNGLKDSASWNGSKLSLAQETDSAQKITEEISRLVSLANTVLSTKIPDLSCGILDTTKEAKPPESPNSSKGSVKYLDLIEEVNAKITDTTSVSDSNFSGTNSNRGQDAAGSPLSASPVDTNEDSFSNVENLESKRRTDFLSSSDNKVTNKKEYHAPHYIEDESGFSSMSSFQDIGIPIINIVPPTPCKDVAFSMTGLDLLEGDKWKASGLELDKQTVQVFWV